MVLASGSEGFQKVTFGARSVTLWGDNLPRLASGKSCPGARGKGVRFCSGSEVRCVSQAIQLLPDKSCGSDSVFVNHASAHLHTGLRCCAPLAPQRGAKAAILGIVLPDFGRALAGAFCPVSLARGSWFMASQRDTMRTYAFFSKMPVRSVAKLQTKAARAVAILSCKKPSPSR